MTGQGSTTQGNGQAEASAPAQMTLAIFGSILGTLITGALDTSPTVRLIGAALGSAVPTLVAFAGPYRRLRAGIAVGITALALFLTYGGFTLFDFARDRNETFPLPSALPEPEAGRVAREEPEGPAPVTTPTGTDADADGYALEDDCDDQNPDVNPGATDVVENGIDEDCDGQDALGEVTTPAP